MAWLESHQELADHPKAKRAARKLRIGIPQMVGHLHCLWWWAMDYAPDGELRDFEDEDIAEAARWEGDASAFVAALESCGSGNRAGFLTAERALNDWDQYGGKYLKRREQARERQRKRREQERESQPSHADVTRDSRRSHSARGQDKREQESKSAPQTARNRPRNEIWDALIAVCPRPTTASEESDFGKTVNELRSAKATPDEIAEFALWWDREMPPGTMLTHRCYRHHWSAFKTGITRAEGAGNGRPKDRVDREYEAFKAAQANDSPY